MSDNIGKITVAIEAQTEDLKSGLQSAEKQVKDSAKKMETATEGLAQKAERSWTEFASKMGVIQQVAGIAKNAMKSLADISISLGDESTTAAEKYNGALNILRDSGIPIISEAVSIGQSLRDMFSDDAKELAKLNAEMQRLAEMNAKIDQQLVYAKGRFDLELAAKQAGKLTDIIILESDEQVDKIRVNELKTAIAREALEHQLQEKLKSIRGKARLESARESVQTILEEFDWQARVKAESLAEEVKKEQQAREEKAQAEQQALKEKIQREKDAAKKIAEKTMDLETQLSIMLAKQAGDEDKAREIAIKSRYNKMKEGATDAQRAIIEQMQAIDLGGAGASVGSSTGGTASISTAVGGFTVASGDFENKKQTSLLKRIADSNDKVASAIANNGTSGIVVPA